VDRRIGGSWIVDRRIGGSWIGGSADRRIVDRGSWIGGSADRRIGGSWIVDRRIGGSGSAWLRRDELRLPAMLP
jgi:hypothetical protein